MQSVHSRSQPQRQGCRKRACAQHVLQVLMQPAVVLFMRRTVIIQHEFVCTASAACRTEWKCATAPFADCGPMTSCSCPMHQWMSVYDKTLLTYARLVAGDLCSIMFASGGPPPIPEPIFFPILQGERHCTSHVSPEGYISW